MDESSAAKEPQARSLIAERYRVLRVLGEGSTGIVYLCEHTALQKEVAVKVLHRELANNASLVARFTREAQTAARLDHPSSVHVMDFGQDRDGTLYLAMEYVEGRDLAQLLDEEPQLDDERIVHILSCILSALSAAHALGIVHRDLKPENVLIRSEPSAPEQEIVKVCDFGVAQFSPVRMAHNSNHTRGTDTRRVTGDGMLVGTPWYMSPEQARAETLDARSDIYSAGVVLFQLLTRTLPFLGDDVMAVALMHCTTPPPPPSGYGPVHPGLEAVCLRALSKTREARYQSAHEMLSELRAALSTKGTGRSLARISKTPSVPGTKLAVSPLTAAYPTLSGSVTPMGTQAVKHPPTLRRRNRLPSLLVAGVATTVLGVVAMPRMWPSANRAAAALQSWFGKNTPPSAARARVQDVPGLQPVAAGPSNAPSDAPVSEPEVAPSTLDPLPMGDAALLAQVRPLPPAAAAPRARKPRPSRAAAQPAEAAAPPSALAAEDPASGSLAQTAIPTPASAAPSNAGAPPAAAAPDVPAPAAAPVAAQPATPAPPGSGPAASTPAEAPASEAALQPAKPSQPAAPTPISEAGAAAAPKPQLAADMPVKTQPLAAAASPQPKPKIAHVELSAEQVPPGTSRASLRGALSQASLVNCYAQAQERAPLASLPGTALELKTNTSGRIVWAHVSNTALPAPLRECLEQVARSGYIRTGEGGEVHATLSLSPSP